MAYYRNEDQHARKVDRIATFCTGILAAEGPAALEPNQVGRRIDGTGYNVSNIFPNRSSLVALVLNRHTDGLLAAVGQPEDWPGEPHDQLLAMATAYLERVSAARGVHAVLPECRPFLLPATQDAHANCRRWLVSTFRHRPRRRPSRRRARAPPVHCPRRLPPRHARRLAHLD